MSFNVLDGDMRLICKSGPRPPKIMECEKIWPKVQVSVDNFQSFLTLESDKGTRP